LFLLKIPLSGGWIIALNSEAELSIGVPNYLRDFWQNYNAANQESELDMSFPN